MQTVDKLLEKPCYLIDFLPRQVPKNCEGQFFEVEQYFLNHYSRYGWRDRFIRIILKVMCYYQISIYWSEWIEQPTPEQVAEIMDTMMENHSSNINILFSSKEVLIQFGGDCLNMSVYNPDEKMCVLFEQIAVSEGMFWRKEE